MKLNNKQFNALRETVIEENSRTSSLLHEDLSSINHKLDDIIGILKTTSLENFDELLSIKDEVKKLGIPNQPESCVQTCGCTSSEVDFHCTDLGMIESYIDNLPILPAKDKKQVHVYFITNKALNCSKSTRDLKDRGFNEQGQHKYRMYWSSYRQPLVKHSDIYALILRSYLELGRSNASQVTKVVLREYSTFKPEKAKYYMCTRNDLQDRTGRIQTIDKDTFTIYTGITPKTN